MSTSLASKPLTVPQRTTAALTSTGEVLGLTDAKRLAAAINEIALEEIRANGSFADRVRARYEDLAPKKPVRTTTSSSRGKGGKKAAVEEVELIPIKRIEGREVSLKGPLDPYFLLELYGPSQLEAALRRYTPAKLRQGAAIVQERNPGTGLPPKANGEKLIAYIMEQLVSRS